MNPTTESDLAISIKGLSKAYRIWRDPSARLKAPLWDTVGSLVPTFLRPKALKQRLSHGGTSRYYTDFFALDKLDLEIKKGEAIGIIGRNGSGKSTLLQMIAGTLTPTTGQIQVHGRVAALLELGSGFNPEFTGRENVFLNASVLGLSEEQTAQKLDAILEFADIGDFVDQPVKTYSSGMTMRLAFAVIAHVDADILIVDEALAVGDVFFVQKCMRFIRKFKENGTLLIVTHDTSTVQSLCDRAVWLHHGECKGEGDAKVVTENYLEATYAETQGVQLFNIKAKQRKTNEKHTELVPDTSQIDPTTSLKFFNQIENSDGWTTRKAAITNVSILGTNDRPLAQAKGGEKIKISITAQADEPINSPIIGWFIKDRQGQSLFGEHSYTYTQQPFILHSDEKVTAEFHFHLPLLPNGDYAMTVSIAEGDPETHVQHHWLHDAVIFKVTSTKLRYGLVGIPFEHVSITKSS